VNEDGILGVGVGGRHSASDSMNAGDRYICTGHLVMHAPDSGVLRSLLALKPPRSPVLAHCPSRYPLAWKIHHL